MKVMNKTLSMQPELLTSAKGNVIITEGDNGLTPSLAGDRIIDRICRQGG